MREIICFHNHDAILVSLRFFGGGYSVLLYGAVHDVPEGGAFS